MRRHTLAILLSAAHLLAPAQSYPPGYGPIRTCPRRSAS
jgi:hypothetical protein